MKPEKNILQSGKIFWFNKQGLGEKGKYQTLKTTGRTVHLKVDPSVFHLFLRRRRRQNSTRAIPHSAEASIMFATLPK
jgi:hypothetical protein